MAENEVRICGWCGYPDDCKGETAGISPHHWLCCFDYRPLPRCVVPFKLVAPTPTEDRYR